MYSTQQSSINESQMPPVRCRCHAVQISNLGSLRKLDVLDLHSNSIQGMEGLDSLQDLRVLNLAGNHIRYHYY